MSLYFVHKGENVHVSFVRIVISSILRSRALCSYLIQTIPLERSIDDAVVVHLTFTLPGSPPKHRAMEVPTLLC